MKKYTFFTEEFRAKQSTLDERKRILKKKITPSEKIVLDLFKQIKIRAMFQKGFIAGKCFCIVDFYIPQYGLCVEIDGEYHNSQKQSGYDAWRDRYLVDQRRVSVLRISNKETATIQAEDLLKLILSTRRKARQVIYSPSYHKKSPPVTVSSLAGV